MTIPVLEYDKPEDRRALHALVERLRDQTAAGGEVADQVAAIIDAVRREGDDAVVRYMRQWTDPDFTAAMIRVSGEELVAGELSLEHDLRQALRRSIEHVRAYQEHVMPADPPVIELDGARLTLRHTPIRRVGLHVPGGTAAYPSTVVMLAVPAQVAGVERVSVVSPPPTRSGGRGAGPAERADVSPLVLGVCSMLGIERVYRIGGAQGIAALALGTESVDAVDFIAGPGNTYTQQAKRQLFGRVGIDGLFGPSEIVILADDSADPQTVAADLLAQAEHDPGACFLVSTSIHVIEAVLGTIGEQLPRLDRRPAIERALADFSAAVHVPDEATALEVVDTLAAEHVTLAVAEPEAALAKLRHGGAWFLGHHSPVAAGDYYAGPSHCLPTGTTARFSSGLSAHTFLKRSSVEHYPMPPRERALEDIARLAEAEGLTAHAASARLRQEPRPSGRNRGR